MIDATNTEREGHQPLPFGALHLAPSGRGRDRHDELLGSGGWSGRFTQNQPCVKGTHMRAQWTRRAAVLTLALVTAGCTPAAESAVRGALRPAAKPTCPAGEITVAAGQETPCDLTPQTLTVVFDDRWVDGWGSDASVGAAAAECDRMGGEQVWLQMPYRLECRRVDW